MAVVVGAVHHATAPLRSRWGDPAHVPGQAPSGTPVDNHLIQQLKYAVNIMHGAMSVAVSAQNLQALKDAHDLVIQGADQRWSYTQATIVSL